MSDEMVQGGAYPASEAPPSGFTGVAACNHCGWGYLLAVEPFRRRCPHCFQADLSPLLPSPEVAELTALQPELALPYTLSSTKLAEQVQAFTRGIPFPPADLTPANLQARLQRIYLPAWLVDADVRAVWQAEAGFDYEVVSHQERYSDAGGGWQTREVKEKRVRWEPRLGRLERSYANIALPALDGDPHLQRILASFAATSPKVAQPFSSDLLAGEADTAPVVRLPQRSRQDAWPEALPRLQSAAAEECRRACQADHLRDFRWTPEVARQNWTLFLQPIYSTYYLDDDGAPRAVYLHGQSGEITGERRSSLQRAQRASLGFLIAAGVIFLFSLLCAGLGVVAPALFLVGGVGLIVALLVALAAIIPPVTAKRFNQVHSRL